MKNFKFKNHTIFKIFKNKKNRFDFKVLKIGATKYNSICTLQFY